GLSRWNYAIDIGLYPLGSCTMKYNPKINEKAARIPGFAALHPYQPEQTLQGAMALMYALERALCEIVGMARATLQPAAGAHGELAGLMLIRAAHADRGRRPRKVLIPDSAHGTNPASCTLNGFETVTLPTGARGMLEVDTVRKAADADTAAIMITNPSTLGLFEENIAAIADVIHGVGGYVYMDGANLNALLGKFRPGDAGADVMHINLHKTFTRRRRTAHPPPKDVHPAARGRRPRRRPGRDRAGAGAVPARPDGGEGRRSLPLRAQPAEVGGAAAVVLRQLGHVRARLHLHPRDGRRGADARDRDGGPERELPAGPAGGGLRPRLRPAVHPRPPP